MSNADVVEKKIVDFPLRLAARNAEVIRSAKRGDMRQAIAQRFGISTANVSVIISKARRRGDDIPRLDGHESRVLPPTQTVIARVKREYMPYFRGEARMRDCDVERLFSDLLTAIAEDKMVVAVLDDTGGKR